MFSFWLRGPLFGALLYLCFWCELALWGAASLKALLTAPLFGALLGWIAAPQLIDVSLSRRGLGFLAGSLLGAILGLAYALVSAQPIAVALEGACWGSILGPLVLPKVTLSGGNLSDRLQGSFFGCLCAGLIGLGVFLSEPSFGWPSVAILTMVGGTVGFLVPSRADLFNQRSASMPGQALRGGLWGSLVGVTLVAVGLACLYGSGEKLTISEWSGFGRFCWMLIALFAVPGAALGILLNGTSIFRYLNRYHKE